MAKHRKPKPRIKTDRESNRAGAEAMERAPGIEVALLACKLSPSWPDLVERFKGGKLTRGEALKGIVRTWKEFNNRIIAGSSAPADILAALQFWRKFPRLCWLHCFQGQANGEDATACPTGLPTPALSRIDTLEFIHMAAERIIRQAAERVGLNGVSIARSGEFCQDILRNARSLGEFGDWPDCLTFIPKKLLRGFPPQALEIVGEARDIMQRLEDRLALPIISTPANVPPDLVTVRVALREFQVSRPTLDRRRKVGELRGYRPGGAAVNAEFRYSRADLASRFAPRKAR